MEFVSDDAILTTSADMTMCTWNVKTGEKIQEFRDHLGDINAVALSPPNPNIVATGAADNMIKVWDLRTRRSQRTFAAESEVNCVSFFPDGNAIGAGCDDSSSRIFDLRSDCQIGIYKFSNQPNVSPSFGSAVSAVRFSPSGRLLLTGLQNGACGAWDILKDTWIAQFPSHSGEVTSIQASADGHRIYTSSWDSTLRSWEP
jgi:WD40 repeat protein